MKAPTKTGPPANLDLSRDDLMKLLSADDVASISVSESSDPLAPGDEFIDLAAIAQGMQKAVAADDSPRKSVLAKKSVPINTWNNIMRLTHGPGAAKKKATTV